MASDYDFDIKRYQDLLKKSKTAYTPNVKPTSKDVQAQIDLIKAKGKQGLAEGEEIKEQWYGDESGKKSGTQKKGYLSGLLHTLGAPLYAVTGAAESVLGKGTKKGLLKNIVANVEEEGTWGDILRSYNLPNWVSMPVGLSLDIATDPFALGTAGTSAIIPRLAKGAVYGAKTGKGVLSGLKSAAKSGALMKAETVGKFIPGLTKKAFTEGSTAKIPSLYRKVSSAADSARAEYDLMTNKSWLDFVGKEGNINKFMSKIDTEMDKTELGRSMKKATWYSPSKGWFPEMIAGDEKAWLEASGLDDYDYFFGKDKIPPVAKVADKATDARPLEFEGKTLSKELNESVVLANNPQVARASGSKEIMKRLEEEAKTGKVMKKQMKDEWDAAYNALSPEEKFKYRKDKLREVYHSEIKVYDNMIEKVLGSERGMKTLETYAKYIGLFKTAKIGGNLLSSGTNALVGNLVMTGMSGIDVLNVNLLRSMKHATSIVRGKNLEALNELVGEAGWREMMERYPSTFQAIFGLNPDFILRGRAYIDETTNAIINKMSGGNAKQAIKFSEEADDIKKSYDGFLAGGVKVSKARGDILKGKQALDTDIARRAVSTVEAAMDPNIQSTFLSQEILTGPFTDFVNSVKAKADGGSEFAKMFHWYLTKPMDWYGKIDQTYRLGLAMHLTKNGVSERELKILATRFGIGAEDLIKIENRNMWKIKPMKSMEMVQEIYLNYQAMPGFVKMMRTMPILGAPFISFVYGMSANTIKTGMFNPAFFNKMQFMLKEISGRKSPLEKEALAGEYYNWLDKEGMVKLPFFKENPVYLNMENMMPYYTLNMFQNSDRIYDSKVGGAVTAAIDKSPFFKTPEGQVMLDYAILPMLLGEAQGMFGQKLWTKDAGTLEKLGRAAQAGVETVVPPLTGVAGPFIPKKVLPYAPSYRARQLGFATEGKTSIGAPSSEEPTEKTIRALAAMTGWSTYKIKLYLGKK